MKIIIATHDFYFQQGAEVLFNSCEALGVEHFNSERETYFIICDNEFAGLMSILFYGYDFYLACKSEPCNMKHGSCLNDQGKSLTHNERIIAFLLYYKHFSVEQIARVRGRSKKTVYSHIYNVKKKIGLKNGMHLPFKSNGIDRNAFFELIFLI